MTYNARKSTWDQHSLSTMLYNITPHLIQMEIVNGMVNKMPCKGEVDGLKHANLQQMG